MKTKKKIFMGVSILCILLGILVFLMMHNRSKTEFSKETLDDVKKCFATDIQELLDGKYENLISEDFQSSMEGIDGVYKFEIIRDTSSAENSFLENLEEMEHSVEMFFGEDLNKSFLKVEAYISNSETVEMMYDDVETAFSEGKLNHATGGGWIYGKDTVDGKYVQVADDLLHAWYSKNGLDMIHPSYEGEFQRGYLYFAGMRQEDSILHLNDGEIALSELEAKVLDYMNGEQFPLEVSEDLDYGIGEVRVLKNGEYDAVCFLTRRMYKGVPFEYGSNAAEGAYVDALQHDGGEITYTESTSPDTMLRFFITTGTVVETEEVTELFTVGEALRLLSESIGESSVYKVHGVELVYRNSEIPEERITEVTDILSPKWKIVTTNQNDDKYTLFYIDVVTGEITERFEYYYE